MTKQLLRVTDEHLEDLELCGQIMEEEKNDPLLNEGEKIMAICVECEYCSMLQRERCSNPDLPINDFVRGDRFCDILNAKGDCKGFKAKIKPDSIFDSKEDEELAKAYKNPGT